MLNRYLIATALVLLASASSGCAPVFHAGDYAGLRPISPLGTAQQLTTR